MRYYKVSSRVFGSNGPIVAPERWQTFLCESCRAALPARALEPVTIQLASRPRGIGGLAGGSHMSVFHRRLIEQIERELRGRHVIGPVVRSDGKPWADYRSCYAAEPVYTRGATPTDEVFLRFYRPKTCELCSRTYTYYAEPPRYFLSRAIDGAPCYQDLAGILFLRDSLVDRIDWAPFPDVELELILVLDRPLDDLHLPGDPDWSTMPPPPPETNADRRLVYRLEGWAVDDYFVPELLHAARGWTKSVTGTVLCPECMSILPDRPPTPIEAVLAGPHKRYPQPATRIRRTGVPVLDASLAQQLQQMLPDLVLGPCRLSDGTTLDQYRTAFARTRIHTRGGSSSKESVCGTCGSTRARQSQEPRWILREDLRQAEAWLESSGSILLPGHIANGFDVEQWLGLRCWPMAVLDAAASTPA